METKPRAVVVGGGVSGLTAAHRLAESGHSVTVLEAAPKPGGKLATATVAGVPADVGAEAVLARRPEALSLIEELGLGDRITHPGVASSRLYSRGALREIPADNIMGVPGDLAALARSGVLSPAGVLRAARDLVWPATPVRGDVPVAAYIGVRMGAEVVDRLVEPLLGGVYAGRADRLSLDSTLPQIAPLARGERSLMAAVRKAGRRARAAVPEGAPRPPVFATLRGGLAGLVDALAARPAVRVETSATVRELRRTGRGWSLVVGPAGDSRRVDADAVVLACPAPAAARLLRAEVPRAATELDGIEYASMAVVTLAYRASAFPAPPAGSGFLVPAVEDRVIKAVTFSSVKWPWLAEELRAVHSGADMVLLRCSIGRIGGEAVLQRSDEELAALAAADLADICGVAGPPVDSRVTRWGGGLPQYAVGHGDRIARLRSALAGHEDLAVCGAAYDGVGVPACVGGAEEAARLITRTTTRQRSHT
ncbi:protoporphyrinogen oxidase [Actinorugispora endophytica]|uniref:Coproporphyrinogen III oxidase n=1 Tax=Actinorugispora endophytica TaxID=1605990 RepID=A0A4V3D7Z5_9ACTN|nr:protoporphyrinogen oxidase [Actinorugispora endophytica]TDQ49617.1 UDP-galactopyranose mutase [Actinorugispora endophytica]